MILDPDHWDFLSKKVELTLQGFGFSASAVADARVFEALSVPPPAAPEAALASPASELLWEAPRLHNERTGRNLAPIRGRLELYFASNETAPLLRSDRLERNAFPAVSPSSGPQKREKPILILFGGSRHLERDSPLPNTAPG